MSTEDRNPTLAAQLADELKLQAWLAKAEFDHPSLRDVSAEASKLAEVRDELRVQLHLGRMEMGEEWQAAEANWNRFMARANVKTQAAAHELQGMLQGIRDGYERLRKA